MRSLSYSAWSATCDTLHAHTQATPAWCATGVRRRYPGWALHFNPS